MCLGLFSQFVLSQSQLVDGVIGTVGGKVILYSEVETQLVQAKQQGVDLGEDGRCTVYEDLMFQSLLTNQAEIDSVLVPEAQVNAELDNRIRYFEQQIGGRDKLEAYYGKTIEEIKEEFYALIEARMVAEQMKAEITKSVTITPKEVKDFYKNMDKDSIPLVGSKVEVAQITKVPVVNDAVKLETKERLNQIRKDILAGEKTFTTSAVLYSNDPGSRSEGGEFGWVSRGTFVPEFDRIAFSIEEGQISEVFETEYGYHILELFERRGDQYNGRHILLMPKVSDNDLMNAKLTLDSIYDSIMNGTYTFSQAAKDFSDDKESKFAGGLIYNQNTGSSKFEMEELDKQLFVAIDDLEVGDVSKPVLMQTKDGKQAFRIVKLKSVTKPHKANLKDDYQLIQQMATVERKTKAVEDWIKEKAASTYIDINDNYRDCEFVSKWIQ